VFFYMALPKNAVFGSDPLKQEPENTPVFFPVSSILLRIAEKNKGVRALLRSARQFAHLLRPSVVPATGGNVAACGASRHQGRVMRKLLWRSGLRLLGAAVRPPEAGAGWLI
jgi:hypothetical protein